MNRPILEMALNRVREGRGSYEVRPAGTWEQQAPDLKHLLNGVSHVIVNGLATRLYMQERMTLDVDVLVEEQHLAGAEAALEGAGAQKQGSFSIGGSSWKLPNGRILDVIALPYPWIPRAIHKPVKGPDGQPYVALPYLVLLKLAASRAQDLADLSRMLGQASSEALDEVRTVITCYAPEDLEDLESLIKLGKLENKQQSRTEQAARRAATPYQNPS